MACSSEEADTDADDGRPPPGETGAACEAATECYPNVVDGELSGEAVCMEQVEGGYCTHTCEVDTDCCGAEGECPEAWNQVCSPFESGDAKYCLLSCEDTDVATDADAVDSDDYCQRNAGASFSCRSSGGGSENRKICMPISCSGGLGDGCAVDDDCEGELVCDLTLGDGYCTAAACASDDDCPGDGLCAKNGDASRCVRPCNTANDCAVCRAGSTATTCDAAVELLDGTLVAACN